MRIPSDATAGVKQALKDLSDRLDKLGASTGENLDLRGTRIGNAGDAMQDHEYVTLRQLNAVVLQMKRRLSALSGDVEDATAVDGTTPGDDGAEGGEDDGLASQGCAECGSTGHVSAGAPLTAVTAGQVICGTGQEFPALVAACADQASRDANQAQLLSRIIWHLNQAGFTAGGQRNPSGIVSGDKLTVEIEGTFRAYDVFIGVEYFTPMPVVANEVFPAEYVSDAGTAD